MKKWLKQFGPLWLLMALGLSAGCSGEADPCECTFVGDGVEGWREVGGGRRGSHMPNPPAAPEASKPAEAAEAESESPPPGECLYYYPDCDGDKLGESGATGSVCPGTMGCSHPAVTNNSDCDDGDPYAGLASAEETCDGRDNNCNGEIDEEIGTIWYLDLDGDGYGDADHATDGAECSRPTPDYVDQAGDCDDTDADINPDPDTQELCDGLDNNCNGEIDEDFDLDGDGEADDADGDGTPDCMSDDADGDGYTEAEGDCDDNDAGINPAAQEFCDGIDNNCNDQVDEGLPSTAWYYDQDADGYGNTYSVTACDKPDGYVSQSGDCNNTDPAVNPGADELCDYIDNNCDEAIDTDAVDAATWHPDMDGDSFADPNTGITQCQAPEGSWYVTATDCDDTNSAVNPAAQEICDGIDNNCDTVIDGSNSADAATWYADTDHDGYGDAATSVKSCDQPLGYVANSTDCNDSNAGTNPAATEICDSLDNDCDGAIDGADSGYDPTKVGMWYPDNDGDGYGQIVVPVQSCSAPAGYVSQTGDCDDSNAAINPVAAEVCDGIDNNCNTLVDDTTPGDSSQGMWIYADSDSDGYGDAATAKWSCSIAEGYVDNATDCDDANAAINPAATEVCDGIDNNCNAVIDDGLPDQDGDGYSECKGDCYDNDPAVNPAATEICDSLDNDCDEEIDEDFDADADGYTECGGDCDDNDPAVNPGATEVCDGTDDNCDNAVDEGVVNTYYRDTDGDGYGISTSTTRTCSQPSGYASESGDCNDADATINPAAVDSCDGIDNNCDGVADEAPDLDGDGYTECQDDCDDTNPVVNPSAAETCNGLDDDCDGEIDDEVTISTWYKDQDGDGFGDSAYTTEDCEQPEGYAAVGGDCKDTNAAINPDAAEVCDSADNDCDGIVDEGAIDAPTWYLDSDVDGYGGDTTTTACAEPSGYVQYGTDCDDTNPAVNPAATEVCDGIDNNCNALIDDGLPDEDGDGYSTCKGDCNDTNPAVNPTATEACDSADNDCDGAIDEGFDADADGYTNCNGDCNDSAATINPAATEVCDGIDNNCDGVADESPDLDGDGYTECQGDCNDADASVHPGATELCDSVDQDCDGSTEDVTFVIWYADTDGDGYGNAAVTKSACSQPSGYVDHDSDCDDTDPAVNPGAVETCNSIDDDCDGQSDEAGQGAAYFDPALEATIEVPQVDFGTTGEIYGWFWIDSSAQLPPSGSYLSIVTQWQAATAGTAIRIDSAGKACATLYPSVSGNMNFCTLNNALYGAWNWVQLTWNSTGAMLRMNGDEYAASSAITGINPGEPSDGSPAHIGGIYRDGYWERAPQWLSDVELWSDGVLVAYYSLESDANADDSEFYTDLSEADGTPVNVSFGYTTPCHQ